MDHTFIENLKQQIAELKASGLYKSEYEITSPSKPNQDRRWKKSP